MGVYGRGGWLGHEAMLAGQHYFMGAEAVASTRLLLLSGDVLRASLRDYPGFATSVILATASRMDALTHHLSALKLLSAAQRVGQFLLDTAPTRQSPICIALPYSKSLIAKNLGMEPESLSRALSKLRSVGVKVSERSAVITDVPKLSAFVEFGRFADPARTLH